VPLLGNQLVEAPGWFLRGVGFDERMQRANLGSYWPGLVVPTIVDNKSLPPDSGMIR